jgi:hypothetical protein
MGLAFAATQEQRAAEWRRYRKHTAKNFLAVMPDLVRNGARRLSDLAGLFTSDTDTERSTYDTVKQLGFYTDCCGDAHWSIPDAVIDEALATSLVAWALRLTKEKPPVTAQELEIWALHMRNGCTRENILKWCEDMVAAGRMTSEDAAGMQKFL